MTSFKKIDDVTLQATDMLGESSEWGGPKLRRLFNFRSRQVTSIYERGGTQSFNIPRNNYASETGYTAAVTSSMQIQNFRDIEGEDDIIAMHAELKGLNGHPPPLDEILPRLSKKTAALKT